MTKPLSKLTMPSNPTLSQYESVTPLMVNSASYFLLLVIRDLKQRLEILFLLNLRLYFALVQWFQYFFKILFTKSYLSVFFCAFDTSFQRFPYDYVHAFVLVYFL